jgi:salicylate hydroxylase
LWSHPAVRAVIDLLPDELDRWAIFDMMDHPAAKYNAGCVCIAGDAAHAAGPHLGAGAGFGIEDALVLATALEHVDKKLARGKVTPAGKVELCSAALSAYNAVRYQRTQWLVRATRDACRLFQIERVYSREASEWFGKEVSKLFSRVWDYDIDEMVKETVKRLN